MITRKATFSAEDPAEACLGQILIGARIGYTQNIKLHYGKLKISYLRNCSWKRGVRHNLRLILRNWFFAIRINLSRCMNGK